MRSSAGTSTYEDLIKAVLLDGDIVGSRYGETSELRGLQVHLDGGEMVHRARINYGIGWMEALQLIAGTWSAERIRAVAPNADHSLFTDQMAYGPRLIIQDCEQPGASGDPLNPWNRQPAIDQIIRCVAALQEDPNSRQAVVSIARPWETCSNDMPCTLAVQFLKRYSGLDMLVTMRSWDLLKGLPYDIMMFSALHQMVAALVSNFTTGSLVITAGSAHVYLDEHARMVPDHCCGRFYMPLYRTLTAYRVWATAQMRASWVGVRGGAPVGIKVIDHDRRITRKD